MTPWPLQLEGVISTMVVLGFSPKEDFDITNTSPFGALIVDDLKADSKNYSVNIASFGCTLP